VNPKQVTLLASSAYGPGDVEELKEMVESFGLTPIVVPDLSTSLDGHLDDLDYYTTPRAVPRCNNCEMWAARQPPWSGPEPDRSGGHPSGTLWHPDHFFDQLTGLGAVDQFLYTLSQLSGRQFPPNTSGSGGGCRMRCWIPTFSLGKEGCDRP
jgi:hypothetical protein